ncbi:MAG: LacI family DNA-binding transcriptional regulator [Roseburia sp.]
MSLKEIAKRAGVSTATVSRVLNNPNHRCLDGKKRDEIWKLASSMNYEPNEAARNLKTGKAKKKETYYINILVTRGEGVQADPFFSEMLRIIESEIYNQMCVLSQVMYKPIFSDERKCKSENTERMVRELYERCRDTSNGLIILGHCSNVVIKSINKYFKNVVLISRNFRTEGVDAVTCNGSKMARIAVEHLIELGHTDIAYAGGLQNENRYKGYIETLEKHDLLIDSSYIFEVAKTEAAGYDAMKKILELDEVPTGIYCANDIIAVGMLKCLRRRRNLAMLPSIISSDGIEMSELTKPLLTTVAMPKSEIGYYAVSHLITKIERGGESNVVMELEGKLIKRESCKLIAESSNMEYYI